MHTKRVRQSWHHQLKCHITRRWTNDADERWGQGLETQGLETRLCFEPLVCFSYNSFFFCCTNITIYLFTVDYAYNMNGNNDVDCHVTRWRMTGERRRGMTRTGVGMFYSILFFFFFLSTNIYLSMYYAYSPRDATTNTTAAPWRIERGRAEMRRTNGAQTTKQCFVVCAPGGCSTHETKQLPSFSSVSSYYTMNTILVIV